MTLSSYKTAFGKKSLSIVGRATGPQNAGNGFGIPHLFVGSFFNFIRIAAHLLKLLQKEKVLQSTTGKRVVKKKKKIRSSTWSCVYVQSILKLLIHFFYSKKSGRGGGNELFGPGGGKRFQARSLIWLTVG